MGFELVQDLWELSWSVLVGRKIVLEDISHIGHDLNYRALWPYHAASHEGVLDRKYRMDNWVPGPHNEGVTRP